MRETLVQVRHLSRVFNPPRRMFQRQVGVHTVALDDVSLEASSGDCLALIGPNGAGKSTLLRVLATLISPSSGSATICGHDVVDEAGLVRVKIGFAGGSDRSFFWPLSGLENLVFFGKLAGLSNADAQAGALLQLERVGLSAAANNRVAGYSAGMRQRLGLARALLHQPPVILLDEPTANLDAEYRDVTIDLILEAIDSGKVVLVATHDPGLVAATATRVERVVAGRIAESVAARSPVLYRLQLAVPVGGDLTHQEVVEVEDLGDGHALSSKLSALIAEGNDVAMVERVGGQVERE